MDVSSSRSGEADVEVLINDLTGVLDVSGFAATRVRKVLNERSKVLVER